MSGKGRGSCCQQFLQRLPSRSNQLAFEEAPEKLGVGFHVDLEAGVV